MKIFSVSEINGYTKSLLDDDMLLSDVFVSGEISNLKRHSSGHTYFSLKDAKGQISAAMFKWQAQYLRFAPANGMKVIAHGKISLYEAGGQYQMIVSSLQPDGIGALYAAYEKLKARLEEEGLFDAERKRALPRFPARVGVVTSKTGAAVRDIINVISRRWPACEIIIAPVQVQGEDAPPQIVRAVQQLNACSACDVMIVGRGGGSIEDLWAFNDESVVRAVADSQIPVISAVGHETDFTLCDFAADMRAPTPSAAAELAVPDCAAVGDYINDTCRQMNMMMNIRLAALHSRLENARSRPCFASADALCQAKAQRLDFALSRMENGMERIVSAAGERLGNVCASLSALNPLAVLARGYSVVSGDSGIVSSVKNIRAGERIRIQFADGCAAAEVIKEQDDIQ